MERSQAQIVATIGPATRELSVMRELVKNQMDVARLNFFWGTLEEQLSYINVIKEAAKEAGRNIPIIADLAGPRVQEEHGHEFDAGSAGALTEKDLRDLDFAGKNGVDYISLSYVGNAEDLKLLRGEMRVRGIEKPIIAKIERKKALDNIAEIIAEADAVMIGRGDLGNEVPLQEIPYIEQDIIRRANTAGKPVITATQMMVSMVDSPVPTRAEVTDVTYAILSGSDAVMLSEETARGRYPVETVAMMEKIILEAEKHAAKRDIHPL
ncbi:MAG: pyruvate kinase [Candidatus Kaiserbacteria bacterium]|nr:pyruvate kinase [Candidatus Kaiserbacteria bacterium]